jgi:hypothetical protein
VPVPAADPDAPVVSSMAASSSLAQAANNITAANALINFVMRMGYPLLVAFLGPAASRLAIMTAAAPGRHEPFPGLSPKEYKKCHIFQ